MFAIAGVAIFTLTCVLGLVLIEEKKARLENQPHAILSHDASFIEERRSEGRSNVDLEFPYQCLPCSKNKNNTFASTKNISSKGICIRLPEKLPVNSLIKIFIPKNIARQYKNKSLTGKIIWVAENGKIDVNGKRTFETGVQFLNSAM
ncbi:MAG: PilZ domain-containing protein [Candidatus Omnitrophica bacterium]|nr:PilZ domain-containing protein [Candidatus Omnitrophota bacterium]